MVCFQPYVNQSCLTTMGPKQCTPQAKCTHTDVNVDESTLQTCYPGYVTIQLYRNSSSCRASALVYSYNSSTSGCQNEGAYFGTMSCGECAAVRGCVWTVVVAGTMPHAEREKERDRDRDRELRMWAMGEEKEGGGGACVLACRRTYLSLMGQLDCRNGGRWTLLCVQRGARVR